MFTNTRRFVNDILRRLQFSWSILRAVHFLRSRPTMGGAQWDGMERGDKKRKGKHKMKYTRLEAIEIALKDFPKARRIAVENATMGQEDSLAFRMNLAQDCALYKWNPHTMLAIGYVMRNSSAREEVMA